VAAEFLYGHKPVFIFSPHDPANRLPEKRGYRHVKKQWQILPAYIQQLFVRAFVDGIRNPAARVTDVEWLAAFSELLGLRHICSCGAENFWDPRRSNTKQRLCWHKGCKVNYPARLIISGNSTCSALIRAGRTVTSIHMGEKSGKQAVGQMEPHPSDGSTVILRNKTTNAWNATLGQQQMEIPPDRAVPLHPGIQIKVTKKHLFSVCE
jgi:hypothetical protein